MAKGNEAKANLMNRFKTAVGADYVGEDETGKKFYFWSIEGGERIQVCIQMTVPKTPLVCESSSGDLDFSNEESKTEKKNLSEDEQTTLNKLMKELNL